MKRRIEGLASGSSKAGKRRSWRDEADDDSGADGAPPPPPKSDDKPQLPSKPLRVQRPAAPVQRKKPADDEDDLDAALDAALEEAQDGVPLPPPGGEGNAVVWMDISVAGKPRGRVHFELFSDIVPQTADNFRKLCQGVTVDGRSVGYKGSELHKVVPGKVIEGGEFDRSASGSEFPDESFKLTHSRAGLLSMVGAGPDANESRFQLSLRPSPELDNKQVVFGQVLHASPEGASGERLHALHWIEAVGTLRTGAPREAVVVEDCGALTPAEAAKLIASISRLPSEGESQEHRYSRGGLKPPKLSESVQRENLGDVLELTSDCLDSWEWETKKAERSGDKDRAKEIESCLLPLSHVLEEAKYKAGTVTGNSGVHGRKAQSQQLRLRDVQEALQKIY